ncbi:MAG: integration host factor subunit alpha [Magnetococcales bacterium]|nr:integration host factor subunit alpha [Magnetococcales bacterium]MBF0151181.1 integration host factor subunit alpha [Magnetococcales bacterium]MBF0174929.1 integration host factor subunit alpha [Magnetococcales bacterium]MBF0349059.1 integration host factor subunit alpha [Magnetococcales bacterium]MBF0632916.1 integration host factor subunit alpha [Magnetococcales bacterium]
MSLTKLDLANAVYRSLGLSRSDAAVMVDEVFELIRHQLESGETVKLPGFGNFQVRQKNARRGRNPKSGEEVEISARKVVTFKPSAILRKRVNHSD